MLIFRFFRKISKSQGLKCKHIRFYSKQDVLEKIIETTERKYVKPLSTKKLQPQRGCNLNSIFAGTIDKKILEYPTVVSQEDIAVVLSQSNSVESFLNSNQEISLTKDVLEKLKELELFGLTVPQKFGGAGYQETEAKFLHECTGLNLTVARFLGYNEDFGCRIISQYGTEEQKKKYLPDLVRGERFVTLAYLENDSIMDLAKLEGSVIFEEKNNISRCVLNAEKKWIHYADKVDLFLVLAKSASVNEDYEILQKYHFLIVEKNMPGVTVHKLIPTWAEKANLFDISFKGVQVPFNNILGGPDVNGIEILKSGLSHSNLTDSALCLFKMKHLFYDALNFVKEKKLETQPKSQYYVSEKISIFLCNIYALESVIYLLTGSLDMCEKVDLFSDSIMCKILAVDFLRKAIQLYTDILGRESFKNSEIMEDAIEALQYYSVLDENIEYLKMVCASDGLLIASPELAKKVKAIKNMYDKPYEGLKYFFTTKSQMKKYKSGLNLKMELHKSLSGAADLVEENLVKLQYLIHSAFIEHGKLAVDSEHVLPKIAEIASYLFACMACLSRTSSSICHEINNFNNEYNITCAFIKIIDMKIQKFYQQHPMNFVEAEFYRVLGKNTFNYKEYPLEHPLTRVV